MNTDFSEVDLKILQNYFKYFQYELRFFFNPVFTQVNANADRTQFPPPVNILQKNKKYVHQVLKPGIKFSSHSFSFN
jgi:HSP20 family molecular chaperone IbpA